MTGKAADPGPWRRTRLLIMLVCLAGLTARLDAAESSRPVLAGIKVAGLGWWDNRQMQFALERMLGESHGAVLRANAVEDAVFLLLSAMVREGFLRPTVQTRITLQDGQVLDFTFDHRLRTLLPRPMEAVDLALIVDPGVRYVLQEVTVNGGAEVIPAEKARLFFGFGEGFLVGAADRIYSPARLKLSAARLEDELRRRGHDRATVQPVVTAIDDTSGEVMVEVGVKPGPRWVIRSVSLPAVVPEGVVLPALGAETGRIWNAAWQQDTAEAVRQAYFAAGYPDVQVRVEPVPGEIAANQQTIDVEIRVDPGQQVMIGAVRFSGARRTKESLLERQVKARSGEPLDPRRVEEGRYRLSRLGAFRRIDLTYEPAGAGQRDVVYHLQEQPAWNAALLLGYGSYVGLRGGVELAQTNLWGSAHRSRLQLVKSFKDMRADYTYTVPELFGEELDGSVRLFGLQRDETAFQREEYGGTITFRRRVPRVGADGRLGYTYQSLRNKDNSLGTRSVDLRQTTVSSLDAGLTRDRRDNPLRPRRGYRWFGQAELAATRLGGEVDYQRFELGGSYHTAWGRGRWLHAGVMHGVVLTMGATDDRELPVNKRFYPGGGGDIRGYLDGEAAPRDATGAFIGAKAHVGFNLELEQALAKSWSAILFFDALGTAAQLADYPFGERLYSIGLGVRYQTLIGPVRLEYGRNLNPRAGDPRGTLHLTVGFPF